MTWTFDLDLKRLDRLALRYKGGLVGHSSGKRLTNKYGTAMEFADYRPYLPGDDVRRIDWSLYGRSRRLYTKLNRSEVDATVNVLIDGSRSMDWGEYDKGRRALELALALGYLSIKAYDRVAVGIGPKELSQYLPPVHGKGAFSRLLSFLSAREFDREGDLNSLCLSFARQLKPLQLTVLISDFLSPGGWQRGLEKLVNSRQQLLLFHVFSPDELEPEYRGPVSLVDSETGSKKEVDVDPLVLRGYRDAFARHSEQIADFCRQRGINYFRYDCSENPVDFLLTIASTVLNSW
ncbi:MAG: DUF58 domain-containing protein [Firmicutes bacterium]|nr:DUF58 domain-containing protein [Bacillota bacterium]